MRKDPASTPPPANATAAAAGAPPRSSSPYARFIPREELGAFTAWMPGSLSEGPQGATPAAHEPAPSGLRRATDQDASVDPEAPDLAAQLRAARQSGYQDGYRDGLAALEGFKQSFASQITSQVGTLMGTLGDQFDALEKDMARCLIDTTLQLARQVVRSEIQARPELVQDVAREAVDALLRSARQITMRLHPDDQPLVAEGAADVLAARGVRLIADRSIERGGCQVESDIGNLDATVPARWRQAVGALGSTTAWKVGETHAAPAPARATEAPPAAMQAAAATDVAAGHEDEPTATPTAPATDGAGEDTSP